MAQVIENAKRAAVSTATVPPFRTLGSMHRVNVRCLPRPPQGTLFAT